MDFEDQFKNVHEGGLAGLLNTYGGIKGILSSKFLWVAVTISVGISFALILTNSSNHKLLNYLDIISQLGIGLEGSIVGLTLAGLTLVVTFGSGDFLKTLIQLSFNKSYEEGKIIHSIYQRTIAKFGYAVLIQVLALLYLVICVLITKVEIALPLYLAIIFNNIFIFFANIFLIYSLGLVVQMVVNIFTLGQQNHSIWYKNLINEKVKEKKEK